MQKVAVITAGGSGMGAAAARRLAADGFAVSILSSSGKGEALAQSLGGVGVTGSNQSGDDVQRLVDVTMARFGRIDVLVNNAGVIEPIATLAEAEPEAFGQAIDINLKGVYNCTKAVVDTMIEQGAGVILNASSVVGVYGNFGQTNYAASKFGVIGFVKTWAKELGKKGIRANAVCPGFVATPILKSMPEKVIQAMEDKVPMKRMAQPEEIANVYAWLASDEASYINGAAIDVTGGLTL